MSTTVTVPIDTGSSGYREAGWFSKLTLFWLYPVCKVSGQREVERSDVPRLPQNLEISSIAANADKVWAEEKARGGNMLLRTMWRVFRKELMLGVASGLVAGMIATAGRPLVLRELIKAAAGDGDNEEGKDEQLAFILVAVMAVMLMVEGIAVANARHYLADHVGVGWIGLNSYLIQKKSIHLAPSAAGNMSEAGLIGTDVMGRYENLKLFAFLPQSLCSLVSGTIILSLTIGTAGFVGLGLMGAMLLFTVRLGVITGRAESRVLAAGDKRLSAMTRIIESIKAIKFSAWEEHFEAEVHSARTKECAELRIHKSTHFTSVQLGRATPVLCTAASVLYLAFSGSEMKAADIFAAINVFQALRMALILIPFMVSNGASLAASIRRIQVYLTLPDLVKPESVSGNSREAVVVRGSSFSWPKDAVKKVEPTEMSSSLGSDTLQDVSVSLPKGSLVAVIGKVGQGKSSFLASLIGAIERTGGEIPSVEDSVGYVPQKAFVSAGTVRHNILMGRPLDQDLLARVLQMSCMEEDVERFPAGLETELGERGVTLSGGQQQRLCIARAMYGEPALLLADDPLAAVDPVVGSKLFSNCFEPYARASENKHTVVMVLNQHSYLHRFDHVILFSGGVIEAQGTPEEVLANHPEFGISDSDLNFAAEDDTPAKPAARSAALPKTSNAASGALFEQEHRAKGRVNFAVLKQYILNMGCFWSTLSLVGTFLAYFFMSFADFWLSRWVAEKEDAEAPSENSNTTADFEHDNTYAIVYGSATLGFVLFLVISGLSIAAACARTGRTIHNDSVSNIMHATVTWFEQTPSGRLLSRFTSDLSMVDSMLAMVAEAVLSFSVMLFFIFLLICIVVPLMLPVCVLSIVFYMWLVSLVDRMNRAVKRMANNSVSPVLSTLSELSSGHGRAVIWSMRFENLYSSSFEKHLEEMLNLNFVSASVMSSGTLLAYFTAFVVSTSSAVLMITFADVDASSLGLALTYSFMLPYFLQLFATMLIIFVTGLTSLERLLECTSSAIPQEPEWYAKGDAQLQQRGWPNAGCIDFEDTSLVYRAGLPPALNGVNLQIGGGQRVGIVGRTGAGKSSLLVLLFRLVEASKGRIILDGEDIGKIGLQTLRKAMSIIPQEALLMNGTVRYNLDPTNVATDEQVQKALEKVGLNGNMMNTEVGTGASRLSAGEKQLLSLARTLLRKSRIIVLDEPTSNIDPHTDAMIQKALRSLEGVTIITIAHRLDTVIDSDAIVVMDSGHVAEYGHAADLLEKDGLFRNMVAGLGQGAASHLTKRAREAKQQRDSPEEL